MSKMKTITINGNKYIVSDPDAAAIDDSVLSLEKTWSSKKISEMLAGQPSSGGGGGEPGKGLPVVSSADAGKFLRVSADGVWEAQTVINGEEVAW